VLGNRVVEECVAEIADFFSTVPRQYLVYVPLQGVFGASRGRIAAGEHCWIEEFDDAESTEFWQPDLLMDEGRGRRQWDLHHRLDAGYPYLCVKTSGVFGAGNHLGAVAEAFSKVKQFLILSAACEGTISFGPLNQRSIRTGFVVDEKLGMNSSAPVLLPDSLVVALGGWSIYPWGDATAEWLADQGLPAPEDGAAGRVLTVHEQSLALKSWLPAVVKLTQKNSRILRACEWAFDSVYSPMTPARVVLLCIAFETLLGEDTEGNAEETIKERLAQGLANRIGKSESEYEGIRKRFVSFYKLRNKIVHAAQETPNRTSERDYASLVLDFLAAIKAAGSS
jgi:hypothetical protein